jgi:uncharacterized protein (DUF433 family)
MGGKPCIHRPRVTAGTLLGFTAPVLSRERIVAARPCLEPADLDAASGCAAWRLEKRESITR